ncbi:MAG: RluA family pseudouridine synthase [Pyrinomonadaceae bacterium]
MRETFRFEVSAEAKGARLDELLAARLQLLSRMRIADLLAAEAGRVNGVARHAGHRVQPGDVIEIELEPGTPGAMLPEPMPLVIVYEDEHLAVVNKPAGILVHPTRGVKTGTLANALTYHFNRDRIAERGPDQLSSETLSDVEAGQFIRPGLVHRLDRATSGLLVVAKTQRALSVLSRHFHQRRVEKRYFAVLRGFVAEDSLVINAPIGRISEGGPPFWRVIAADDGGRPAETHLCVVERRNLLTLVELEPVTGRTNQLRIHCAHIGNPVHGDEWYGSGGEAARLFLHAARLAFHHPATGEWMECETDLPEEFTTEG